jgi:hypothetical protein
MLKTKNKQKKRNTKQFKKQLNKKTNKMNNQNNPKMDTNQKNQFSEGVLYVRRCLSYENNNEIVTLDVKEENYEKYDKYLLRMIDREEHLNQTLRYQFYCEDLDFNYTVFYDNKVGFEFGEYLKGDVNEIGKLLGPLTLHERLVIIKNELMSTGSISEESILLTDIVFTMFVKTQIIPTLKTILLKNKECIKLPMNLLSNPPKGLSDYVIRLGKNTDGGYYLKMKEEDLMGLSMMTNVMSK